MLLKTILNRIERYKSFVYGKVRMLEEDGELAIEVEVEARANGRPICSGCGHPAAGYDRLAKRRFEYVPLWGIPVFFLYAMRRVECPQCGVKVERVPWAEGKSRLTHRNLDGIEAIGVDEIQWQRGHKYLTMVYQTDVECRRLLWVGKDRTTKTFLRFFRLFGKERSSRLRFVCSDMWKPYLKVIAKKAGQAVHVLDRFHVMSKMNKAIDEVRAAEAKRLERAGYEPVLKHSRWCLLKRQENLTEKQAVKLSELLQYNLQSVRSRLMREDFQRFWEYCYPACAAKFLDEWCTRTMRSQISPMKKVAKTLRRHRELILNWFRAEGTISAGIVEGLNNKAKLTMRKAYGFRTPKAIEIALYHQLGDLPEPEFTHRFC